MPKYEIEVPGKGTFEVDSPTELTDYQAYQAVLGQIKATPPQKKGLGAAFELGGRQLFSSLRTGVESLLPGDTAAANAAIEGVTRQQKLGEMYEAPASLEKVKEAYRQRGLLPAAGEAISQVPGAIAQQIPQIGAMIAGAKVGSVGGPWGALLGAAAVPLAQFFGSNLERQAAEQIQRGDPVDVDRGKAALAAAPQAALDLVQQRLVFGSKLFSTALGIPEKELLKRNAQQVEKLAQEKLLPTLLKGTAKGAAAEIPTEIGQQMIERAQAGLALTSPDALAEYGETAYQVGLLGPLGAVGRISEKGAARRQLEAQGAVPPAPPAPVPPPQGELPLEGGEGIASPLAAAPKAPLPDEAVIAEMRGQYDTLSREIERLGAEFERTQDPARKQALLAQGQKFDFARREIEGKLRDLKPEPTVAPEQQLALDFEQPEPQVDLSYYQPKTKLAEPTIIGEQAAGVPDTSALRLDALRRMRDAGEALTPAEQFQLRELEKAEQAKPAPEFEIPTEVGTGARPTSYLVDDAAINTFGLSKKATKLKDSLRGLDLMNPEDRAKFDDLVEKHERKPGAKIDMEAVDAFKQSMPEAVPAREVPEREGLPAREYTPRQQYQQAREMLFAFGQEGAPLSPRDRRALAKQASEAEDGTIPGAIPGTSEPSVSVPSGELEPTAGVTAPATTGLAGAEPDIGRPAPRARAPRKTGAPAVSPFEQLIRQTTEGKPDLVEEPVAKKEKEWGRGTVESPAPTRKGTAYMQGELFGKTTIDLADRITQGDLKGALEDIASSKQYTPLDNLVAKRLLQSKTLPKVEIVSLEVTGGYPAQYDPNTDTVQITPGNIDSHTVLHETVHGFLHVMIRNSEAREAKGLGGNPKLKNLKDVYNHVLKKRPDLLAKYGMKDLSEFASEAMSNPDFQNDLRNTPYKRTNVFTEFARAVLRAIGVNVDKSGIAEIDSLAAAMMSVESALSTGRKAQEDVQAGVRQQIEPEVAKALGNDYEFSGPDTVGLTDKRIKNLFSDSADTMDDSRAKGYIGYVNPVDFLNATRTPEEAARQEAKENRPLNKQELAEETQPIMLIVEKADISADMFRTIGHEGRHRMMALRDAGVTQVPVYFKFYSGEKRTPLKFTYITPQRFDGKSAIDGFMIRELTPVNYDNYKFIKEKFGAREGQIAYMGKRLNTVEDVIADGIQRYADTMRKNKVKLTDTRETMGRRAESALDKVIEGIENRLKDLGVSTTRDAQGNTELETVINRQIIPQARELVKEGFDIPKVQRTQAGTQAEQLMGQFGGPAPKENAKFLERQKAKFEEAKDNWQANYDQNQSWVAATFGKLQNIASFDQAFNNRLYNHFMDLKKKGDMTLDEAKQALLRISTSQALHRQNLANQIIDKGNYGYDATTNRWYAVDDAANMNQFEGLINTLATRLGVEPTRAKQIMGAAYEANRLNGMYNDLNQVKAQLARAQQDILKIKDPKQRGIKSKLIDALKDKEEELEGKVRHKSYAQVQAGMQLYNSSPEIQQGTALWNTMRERVIKMMVETGVKTQEQAEAWLDEAAYVPFFRDMGEEAALGPKIMTRGLRESMRDYRMKGSEREVADVIDNMYRWMQWSISRSISNKQLQVMADNYAKYLPDEIKEGKASDKSTFVIYRDGVPRYYNVADPAIGQAFMGLEPIFFPALEYMAGPANFLRHAVTRNPIFAAAQLFMDSYSAMFTSGLKNPFGVLKEIAKETTATLRGTSDTRRLLQEYGILETQGYAAFNEADAIGQRLNLEKPGAWAKLAKSLDRMSAGSDNVVRQGIYNQARKEGLSHAEAMEKAAEVVNFRRMSSSPTIQVLSRVVPFFNAYLQVASVAVKTLSGRGISPQDRTEATKVLVATTAKITALSALYAMLVGDDEDYLKKNRVSRDRSWVIPGTGGLGIPVRLDIFALPKIAGEYGYQIMTDKAYADSKMVKSAIARALKGSLNPPSEGIPQIVRPTLGVLMNYDSFQDREIVNATMRRLDPERQYNKNTSEMAKALGQMTGISPLQLDFLLRGYFGSLATLTALGTNDIINAARGAPPRPERSLNDIIASLPSVGGFMTKEENTAVLSDYYEAARDVNRAVDTLANMKFATAEEKAAYREEFKKELALKGPVQSINKMLVNLKRREQMIREAPESRMTAEQKQIELRKLDEQRSRLAKNIANIRQKLYNE